MALAACGGGSSGGGSNDNSSGSGDKPTKGGTLTFLTLQDQFQHLDPQRNYTGEDLAFASGYLHPHADGYKFSTDGKTANELAARPRHRHGHAQRRRAPRGRSRSRTA